ncbi:MAG: DoxX family protein [Spirosomaceae bacterium]|nr:DoxX family protein [Spirosomataceae bacterium]
MNNNSPWSLFRRIIFRFIFIFFFLNLFPFPLGLIPVVSGFLYNVVDEYFWNLIVQFLGKSVLDVNEITVRPNGSGDTTWNWLQQLGALIIAAVGCIIWSIADAKRKNYERLNYWFCVLLRYYLAFTMFNYGFIKVFPLQFGNITTYRLYERLGEMSPMGLLWTFMAYSEGYQFFSGLCEVVAGLLLLFRRTTTLGALVAGGVMLNVFMLNLFFDVPVKIYSFLLVIMSVYLAFDDLKRLWRFFVMNLSTEPRNLALFSDKKWFKIGRIALKVIFILGSFGFMFYESWESSQYKDAPKSAIYGAYSVDEFKKNNVVNKADTLRWQEVFIDRRGTYDMFYLTNESGLRTRINFEKNTKNKTIKVSEIADTTSYTLNYIQPDSSSIILKGKFKKDSIYVSMKKFPQRDFLLTSRGFHWVNEYPFNK